MPRRLVMAALPLLLAACGGIGSLGLGGSAPNATQEATRVRGGEVVAVNRYLWAASLDVLDFLPISAIDPYTGVISTGYGTPPGGGRAYRATVHISDPALDARALSVALQTSSGPVSAATARAVEDAILTRARQLRVQDGRL
ncbi:DUF3576 domain-containing protein [Poseidonocella pacifica]|nr:DUF3576 domain-containing protein [Poseidonocella pacifica]